MSFSLRQFIRVGDDFLPVSNLQMQRILQEQARVPSEFGPGPLEHIAVGVEASRRKVETIYGVDIGFLPLTAAGVLDKERWHRMITDTMAGHAAPTPAALTQDQLEGLVRALQGEAALGSYTVIPWGTNWRFFPKAAATPGVQTR